MNDEGVLLFRNHPNVADDSTFFKINKNKTFYTVDQLQSFKEYFVDIRNLNVNQKAVFH